MAERMVIYSAVFGPHDFCPTFARGAEPACDLVLFTPEADLVKYLAKRKLRWKVLVVKKTLSNNSKGAKEYKLKPHEFLGDYDVSLWVDANICILKRPEPIVLQELAGRTWAQYPHSEKIRDAYHEARRCIELRKDAPAVIEPQIAKYRAAGYPQGGGVGMCYVLMRRHRDPAVAAFGDAWWAEVKEHSHRDQISWPYVRWRTGFEPGWISTPSNSWLHLGPHVRRETHPR